MEAQILFHQEEIQFELSSENSIRDWLVRVILHDQKQPGDLNIIFTSDAYLLEMNKQYLEHDYFTDIITFDYRDGDVISGDLFISVDRVRDNATSFDRSFTDELHRVIVHGVLHLLGLNDKSPEDKVAMREREDYWLTLRDF